MESTRAQQKNKKKEYPPTSLKPNHVCRIFRGKEKDVFGMFEMQLKSKKQKALCWRSSTTHAHIRSFTHSVGKVNYKFAFNSKLKRKFHKSQQNINTYDVGIFVFISVCIFVCMIAIKNETAATLFTIVSTNGFWPFHSLLTARLHHGPCPTPAPICLSVSLCVTLLCFFYSACGCELVKF